MGKSYCIQQPAISDSIPCFRFQKEDSNLRSIVRFFGFFKIRVYVHFHTRSEEIYKSDWADVYDNVQRDSDVIVDVDDNSEV